MGPQQKRSEIPILAYHALVSGFEIALPGGWSAQHAVSCFSYCTHLNFFNDYDWETVGLEAFADARTANVRERVAITFDDGHASDMFAADELERRGLIATFFVPWSHLGRSGYLERRAVVELVKRGFKIGSHGLEHLPLTGKSRIEVEYELKESKSRLEDLTGAEIRDLAFPFGRYDRTVIEAATAAGYQMIVTSDIGIARPGRRRVLPRLPVTGTTTFEEFCRLLSSKPATIRWERILRGASRRLAKISEHTLNASPRST
jgi:peptidoglycan/xylan/chitin deacetylase (PgdA/CDA1 family)